MNPWIILKIVGDIKRSRIFLFLSLSFLLMLTPLSRAEDEDLFYKTTHPLVVQYPGQSGKSITLPKDTVLRTRNQLARVVKDQLQPGLLIPKDHLLVQIISTPKNEALSREAVYSVPVHSLKNFSLTCDPPELLKQLNKELENLSPPNLECQISQINPFNWTRAKMKSFVSTARFSDRNLEIISRKTWGAESPTADLNPMGPIHGIVIHHSAGLSKKQSPLSLQQDHMHTRGWADIGYHYVLSQNPEGVWKVFQGRSLQYQGAHAGKNSIGQNLNPGQVGIVLMGNYQKFSATNLGGYLPTAPESDQQPPPEAVLLLGKLIQKLKQENPSLTALYGHGQGSLAINPGHSDCPGEGCLELVEAMKNRFIK
jgi:hypothetical protein